ncbi:MAG: hypothetical protein JSW50_03075, partial [Candidatus Latescibacterota bacterium]
MTCSIRTHFIRFILLVLLTAAILCVAASSASAGDENPADTKRLQEQYQDALDRGDLAAAAEFAEEIYWARLPATLDAMYDVTSLYCQLGDMEQAYRWLEH